MTYNSGPGLKRPGSFLPARVRARVVVPQPDTLQVSQGEGCGQQEQIHPTSLKHRLSPVTQVVGLAVSVRALHSYGNLRHKTSIEL